MQKSITLSASILALAVAGLSVPAFAEEAPATPAADAAVAEPTTGLTDIVVTATKRETNLQKTPIAISVLGADVVEKRHVQSLIDLADGGVPSLRVATFEARQSALTIGIRGIVPFDQNQVAREPGVGVYIDGVYLGRSQGLNASLFDVQRIEVLRGPQGTLFGRNTEGGALSIVTKAPTGEFGGRVSAGVGNYGAYDGEFHLNLPAVANFAIKVDGLIDHQGATVRNPASGQYGWNYHNRVGGRIAGRWTPVSGLTVDVAYDQAKDENTPFYSQLINYNPNKYSVGSFVGTTTNLVNTNGACNVVVSGVTTNPCIRPLAPLVQVNPNRMSVADLGVIQQPSVDETHGFSATIKYKLSPDLELRSITAWRGVETHQWDGSAGAHRNTFTPNGAFGRYSLSELFQHQFSQELQAVGSIPQVDFVFGGYYFNEHVAERAATPNPLQWNADGTGYTFINQVAPNPTAPITSSNQGWDRRYWFLQRDSRAVGKSYGVFGQATYTPAGLNVLHLTVGGRYTHETRVGALTTFLGNGTPVAAGALNYSNSRFDPMVTLAWDAADGINLYAKFSTGFRSGGANSRSTNFRQFAPEEVKSYEIGAKTDFLDHRVRLNLAGYIMDRKGTQIDFDFVDTSGTSATNPNFNKHTEETANAPGNSRIKGVEAELTVKPTSNLQFGMSYAYTDVKVPATPNPLTGPLFGIPYQVFTVFTPKNAVSGSIDYELPVGASGMALRLHADANYSDPVYSFQAESVKTDKSFIVNASLALADIPLTSGGTKATISVWARNLLNEQHIYRRSNANDAPTVSTSNGSLDYTGVLGDYANFNAPRTFGIKGTVNF
ncbi:MAG TPA: TonB-dependent receptor [Novosphingobium sp.]|nr:TonB-dependent receptor [Novosphingobium sp.]